MDINDNFSLHSRNFKILMNVLLKSVCMRHILCSTWHRFLYAQGQSPQPHVREYFYYVDHNGQLFLDDARFKNFTSCFKDPKFLEFFFSRIQVNLTERYTDQFPFLSLCGRERNYLRCDDKPIVFVDLKRFPDQKWYLLYGSDQTSKLSVPFTPEHVHICPKSGRLYHPTKKQPKLDGNKAHADLSIGLLCSRLAINLSPNFRWTGEVGQTEPSVFIWDQKVYKLSGTLANLLHRNA
ncbi:UPF0598 protein C8orf82 [Fasciola gigantica]|uniref:UPF0598 protein C8orf82 n=1 Tax=Fasciola gigantica TaxID=46835 RepID=A0A504Z4Q2_FASGI|nr:UPF0598 protein C8orf82 [Fasciola gigantica]